MNIICEIINDASIAYKNHIPTDRWKEPYMPISELKHEISQGIIFYCYEEKGERKKNPYRNLGSCHMGY